MNKKWVLSISIIISAIILAVAIVATGVLQPPRPEPVKTGVIADSEYEPSIWGQLYPLEYASWTKTQNPRPINKSFYKKGWDTDKITYDKLSEYPYLALLYNGFGFGIEYNEPRGHWFMITDQIEIDKSRVSAGGTCLTCKSPYISKLLKENGKDFHKMPFLDAVNKIPEKHRTLGAACIDCHDNKTMELKLHRTNIIDALKDIDKENPDRHEMRNIVCGQCHCTYVVQKDENMKSKDLFHPWKGSKYGNISIENIIKILNSDPSYLEWKQAVTGFKLAFLRHPEFEFFTKDSVHFKAGVACADCHMPYIRVGANKISDHDLMSPLKADLKACAQCHTETFDVLKEQIKAIQDRSISMLNRAGYATATTAKLFELVHKERDAGKNINKELYDLGKQFYLEAFYRLIFLGAENSIGFHNPSEFGRIIGDSIAFAQKAESYLRQILVTSGVEVPTFVNLELDKYLKNRGSKPLNFKPEQEFKDLTGVQDILLPESFKGIK